ncbi:MAG TPA: DUF3352 domain-containing protein [Mycobacteriales bacterium]
MDEQFRPDPYGRPPQWGPPQDSPRQGPPEQPYGQPQYGPPPAQPQYGPPPYGPPQYAPQYGPPPGAPYGQPRYGSPDPYGAGPQPPYPPPGGFPGGDQLGSAEPRRSRGRVIWAGIATVAVVALTAGGVYAYTTLSGGGAELAGKVPADAVAYAEVNLDPPAGQKVAAIRFLRHFPDAKVGSDSGTLIESVIEPLIDDPEARQRFVEDIKPWIGKHVAVAVDPQGGTAQPVVIVEATDTAKARAGLDRLNAQEPDLKDKVHYAVSGDIVYVAEKQAVVDAAVRDASAGALSSNGTFTGDVAKVGDEGIVTFWSDLSQAAKLDPQGGGGSRVTAQGRVVGSLRFTDTTADLTVRAIGNPARAGSEPVGPRLRTLPADTVGAAALSGGDELVRSFYDQLDKAGMGESLSSAEEDLGLTLPDDIAALVGSQTVLAVGPGADEPEVGMVSRTDDPAAARRAAEKILAKLDPGSSVTVRSSGDGTVLATTTGYADKLTASGTLGQQGNFTAALPDLDGAKFALYVDVQKAIALGDEEAPASAKAVKAFGITAGSDGDTSTVHFRVLVG